MAADPCFRRPTPPISYFGHWPSKMSATYHLDYCLVLPTHASIWFILACRPNCDNTDWITHNTVANLTAALPSRPLAPARPHNLTEIWVHLPPRRHTQTGGHSRRIGRLPMISMYHGRLRRSISAIPSGMRMLGQIKSFCGPLSVLPPSFPGRLVGK